MDLSGTDAATRYYVQRQLLEFRLAGVDKDDATRAKLQKLNVQLTDEESAFDRNISDDQKSTAADPAELAGLPQDYIAAHKPGADGKVEITTNYPDFIPAITFAKSDDLRKRLMLAFTTRGYPKNGDVLMGMMKTRYEIAQLLGYDSWADYNAADKMIVKGSNIADFIQQVYEASHPLAEREFAMILKEKQKVDPGATTIGDYESGYFSEQLRRSQYDFDSQSVRPYFPFAQVKQGILDTAADLFHVTFKQEMNVPAWDPAVETWLVYDHDKPVGRILSGLTSTTGEVQPRGNGAGSRWNQGQATAGGDSGLQFCRAHCDRSRADGIWRRADLLPRVWPLDAPHSWRTTGMGWHLGHQHGVRFCRGAFANARRMDPESAGAGEIRQELQNG